MVTTRSKSSGTTTTTTKPTPQKRRRKNDGPPRGKKRRTSPRILEKGTFYFLVRPRVNVDSPTSVSDIARSFLILQSAPHEARLIVLPKKVLPGSAKDRFIAFVEKTGAGYEDLRALISEEEYETKTAGKRRKGGAVPVGEGVYVLCWTGGESHLSYVVTLADEMGGLRSKLRLRQRGSFIVSSRNPGFEPPGGARVPEGPDYPKKVLDKFNNLRWVPAQPEFMDYARAQILLIGDKTEFGKEVEGGEGEAADDDDDDGAGDDAGDDAVGVLNELESDDVERMKHLSADEADAIYEDLHSRALEHSGVVQKP